MLFGFNLNEIFLFPFKDEEACKHFLIGCLVSLAAFIIPILPYLVLYGYAARIARQVMNNEPLRMIAWEDWGGLAKDGVKMLGVRLLFSLPIILLILPIIVLAFVMPIVMSTADSSEMNTLMTIFMVVMFGSLCLIIPISIPLSLIIPAAEMHVVEKDDFAAGLKFRDWWPIFRANMGGFIAAFAIYYFTALILLLGVQIIGATIILACLLLFLVPAMTMYITLIMYVTTAQAYKDGKAKLARNEMTSKPA